MRSRVGEAVAVGLLVLAAGCSSHPVGPARTYAAFEGKAATTAESALSSVESVRLAAGAGADDHAPGPFLGRVVSDQEEALAGVQGTFGSIQPPGDRADRLRAELDELLSSSSDHVAAVRVAIRRGQLGRLRDVAEPLDEDAAALRRFVEAHR